MPSSPGATDNLQLSLTGLTLRSQGRRFDVPFDISYTMAFPALPKELIPGANLNSTATVSAAAGAGRPSTQAFLRMDWGTLVTPEGKRINDEGVLVAQDCPSSGAPCVKRADAQGIDSATLMQTLKVPSLTERSGFITINNVPTIQIFLRLYVAGAGGNYNNGRAVEWRYVPGRPSLEGGAPPDQCLDEESHFEELKFRQIHLRLALERERNYHSLLDAAHEDLRSSIYAGLVVDLAGAAPVEGWPLSAAVARDFFNSEKNKLAIALLGAGLKSVESRMLKDQSAAGVGDQLTKLELSLDNPIPIDGAPADVAWEGVKQGLEGAMGKSFSGASFFAFDMLKFGLAAYEGMNQLDASREMLRKVNEHILHMDELDWELADVLVDAQSALELCTHNAALRLPPNRSSYATSFNKVAAYMAKHK
jgi:hypothetical protein